MLLALAAFQFHIAFSAKLSDKPKANHATCMDAFVKKTKYQVSKWPVRPAAQGATDRVAATNFNVEQPELLALKIRWMSRVLGPKWAMQVFYTTEEHKKTLDALLGHPKEMIWTNLYQGGKVVRSMTELGFNKYVHTHDHWDHITHEHVLWFEADSMLLQGGSCMEPYLKFDYTGAPWPVGFPYQVGGNGGFSLLRKSAVIKAIDTLNFTNKAADLYLVEALKASSGKIAPRDMALSFSNEGVCIPTPCGIHKPVCKDAPWKTWCLLAEKTFTLAKLSKLHLGLAEGEEPTESTLETPTTPNQMTPKALAPSTPKAEPSTPKATPEQPATPKAKPATPKASAPAAETPRSTRSADGNTPDEPKLTLQKQAAYYAKMLVEAVDQDGKSFAEKKLAEFRLRLKLHEAEIATARAAEAKATAEAKALAEAKAKAAAEAKAEAAAEAKAKVAAELKQAKKKLAQNEQTIQAETKELETLKADLSEKLEESDHRRKQIADLEAKFARSAVPNAPK